MTALQEMIMNTRTRRQVLSYTMACAGAPILLACNETAAQKTAEKPDLTPEQLAFSSGDPEAKLVMQEFLSLTCSHCARFHRDGFPLLKPFIDDGKLLLVYRDFPLDGMALRAAMLARALPPALGVKFQHLLLENQSAWVNRDADLKKLEGYARVAGLSPQKIAEIFEDRAGMEAMVTERQQATDEYGVEGTPAFVMGKELFSGGGFPELAEWVAKSIT